MALIVDPDNLNQGTEVTISTAARTITLNLAGLLSEDGVTGQALYSFLKEEWKNDSALIPYPFPMIAITPEQFEFVDGWKPANDATRKLIRTAGWREYDAAAVLNREYLGAISLGNIDATSKTVGDKAYYAFASDAGRTEFTYAGPVNEAVQTYGDASNGNFDKRSEVLTLYIRQQGKTYQQTSSTDIGVSLLGYIVYRFPLSESTDLNIAATDNDIDTLAPYTGMSITYYATAQQRNVGATAYDFHVIVEGNAGSKQEIYEYVQRQLRRDADIDAGAGTVNGYLAAALLRFVGSTLETLDIDPSATEGGVAIDNFDANDTNALLFRDDTGASRTFPFVAAGSITFNANLVDDGGAIYRVFFDRTIRTAVADAAIVSASGANCTLSSPGANLPTLVASEYVRLAGFSNATNNGVFLVTGTPSATAVDLTRYDGASPVNETGPVAITVDENPIDSPSALLVDNNAGVDIAGNIVGASVSFDFDYDGNVQGGRTAGTDAPIVIRAIGLDTAQYVEATGTIIRATGQNFSVVAPLERNYANP